MLVSSLFVFPIGEMDKIELIGHNCRRLWLTVNPLLSLSEKKLHCYYKMFKYPKLQYLDFSVV